MLGAHVSLSVVFSIASRAQRPGISWSGGTAECLSLRESRILTVSLWSGKTRLHTSFVSVGQHGLPFNKLPPRQKGETLFYIDMYIPVYVSTYVRGYVYVCLVLCFNTCVLSGYRKPVVRFSWSHDAYGVTNDLSLLQPRGGYVRPFVSCRQSQTVRCFL